MEDDEFREKIDALNKQLAESNAKDQKTEKQMNVGMIIAIAGGTIVILWGTIEAIKVFAPETYNAILSVFGINWTKSREVVLISLIFLITEILSDF